MQYPAVRDFTFLRKSLISQTVTRMANKIIKPKPTHIAVSISIANKGAPHRGSLYTFLTNYLTAY
jgi:hypothetical protein